MYLNRSTINMQSLLAFIATIILMQACNTQEQEQTPTIPDQLEINKGMEEINRQFVIDENAQIDGYIERHGWEMTKTGTGLRYMLIETGAGPVAVEGQIISVAFIVSLLDGEELYSSADGPAKDILIGQDNVESGLHEAMTYLRKGDLATIILPSYLAHGLSGDGNKIPPRSSVVYDILVVDLK